MSGLDLGAIRDDIEMAARSSEMARHVALDHGPELIAEVERLQSLPARLSGLRDDVSFYREWSNELASNVPEEYDDDVAQEAIISKWAKDVAAEVSRLRAQETRIRQVHRPVMDWDREVEVCFACMTHMGDHEVWPCDTAAALDTEGER